MKPTTFSASRIALVILAAGLTIGLVSWDHRQAPGRFAPGVNDTVPKIKTDRDKKVRDLDDVMDELEAFDMKETMEKVRKELAEAMKDFDGTKIRLEMEKAMKDVDFEKIQREFKESMSKVDFDKIKSEMAEAMKSFDMEKLELELKESMAKVDFDKFKEEMAEAMKGIDLSKLELEFKESMNKIDMDKLKQELEKVKNIDMKEIEEELRKVKEEMNELGPRLEKDLEKAKTEIEKAKVELKEYKTFVDGLDKDGLINKKETYTLKHEDGELYINGKKASQEVYNKYRVFLEKHKKFSIKKDDDDFDIDMD